MMSEQRSIVMQAGRIGERAALAEPSRVLPPARSTAVQSMAVFGGLWIFFMVCSFPKSFESKDL